MKERSASKSVSLKEKGGDDLLSTLSGILSIDDIHQERLNWQQDLKDRYIGLPEVIPQIHTNIATIFDVVRLQTFFLVEKL